jgi:hypothetical protein
MPNELREMGVSGSAFGLDHSEKGRTDAEDHDQRVSPFRFAQRGILLCLVCADCKGLIFIDLLHGTHGTA